LPQHRRGIAQCANAKDMGIPETIVTSNWDASNAQVTIWQISITVRNDLVMSDVSYMVKIITRITRDVLSTKSYKKSIPTTSSETVHSCSNQTYPTNSTRNYICLNNQTKFLCTHKYRARATYKSNSSANQWHERIKELDEKPFWANGNYAKPPYNRAN
jgi:hypothetical protein